MKMSELKTSTLKRELGLTTAHFRWHNRNNHGGNFGIDLRYGEFEKPGYEYYEITGYYNKEGDITSLCIGLGFNARSREDVSNMTMPVLIERVKYVIEQERQLEKAQKKTEDKPKENEIYRLTSGSDEKSIMNGNTWEESKVS